MLYDILFVAIVFAFLLVPILAPSGRWFWISSAVITAFISYQWVQSYLYRANIENKYGPGHMLGDILGAIVAGVFVLGLSIRFLMWVKRKYSDGNIT